MSRLLPLALLLLLPLATLTHAEAVLAYCPDEIVYGDPAHPNVLEYGLGGKVRRLHFETVPVQEVRPGRYAVVVPRILTEPPRASGWANAHPASAGAPPSIGMGKPYAALDLTVEPETTFSSSRLRTNSLHLLTLDRVQRAPGLSLSDLLDGWRSEIEVSAEPGRAGT